MKQESQFMKCLKKGMLAVLGAAMLFTGMPAANVSASVIEDESTIPAGNAVLATKDYLVSDGTGIDYNAPETYVLGYMQNGSNVGVVNGNYINIHFSREIKYTTKLTSAEKKTEEYVEFIQNQTDTDGDGKNDSYCDMFYATPRDDNKTVEYLTVGKFKKLDPNRNLNLRVFIMCFHNLKSDLEITYDFVGEHVYQIAGSANENDTRPFVNGKTLTANKTTIEIKAVTVKFDTSKAPSSLGVRAMEDVDVVQGDKLTDPGTPRANNAIGYDFAGWFTKPDADPGKTTDKWDFDDPVTTDMTLYALYTPKTNVPYRIEYKDSNGEVIKDPEKGTGAFGETIKRDAPTIEGYEPVKEKDEIKLTSMEEEKNVLTFIYTANKGSYTIQRFKANTDGTYPAGTSDKTTYTTYEDDKDVLVGQTVTLTHMNDANSRETAGINANEYTFDDKAGNVLSGSVETGGLTLKVYFKRVSHKVSFDTSRGPQGNSTVTTDVPDQSVPFGKEIEDPGTPEASDDEEYNFDGWYKDDKPWDFDNDTMPATDITLTPHWSKKVVTITFTEPKYIMKRAKIDVTQLMFTVEIDGRTLNRANYDSYNAEQKAILDSVAFSAENIAGFDAATSPQLANLVVGTIAKGGSVIPGKSGVAEVTAEYMGVVSTNKAVIIVPGDMNHDGSVNVTDASICASYVRNIETIDNKTYTKDLGDMNADGFLTVADCTIMCQMLRDTADYNNSYLDE